MMTTWTCTGDTETVHEECSFTTQNEDQAWAHFESTGHDVTDLGPPCPVEGCEMHVPCFDHDRP